MRRVTLAVCLLASSTWFGEANAQVRGLIDRPSPPPCAADGTCYPNTESWGYYQAQWRTWPGVAAEPATSKLEPTPADLGPELTPHETPPPELEDKQAPPASTKRPPQAPPQPAEEGAEGEATPPPTAPPTPTGLPTGDADPPPAFPLSLSARASSAIAIGAPTAPRRDARGATSNDPPPTPPWSHRASM